MRHLLKINDNYDKQNTGLIASIRFMIYFLSEAPTNSEPLIQATKPDSSTLFSIKFTNYFKDGNPSSSQLERFDLLNQHIRNLNVKDLRTIFGFQSSIGTKLKDTAVICGTIRREWNGTKGFLFVFQC